MAEEIGKDVTVESNLAFVCEDGTTFLGYKVKLPDNKQFDTADGLYKLWHVWTLPTPPNSEIPEVPKDGVQYDRVWMPDADVGAWIASAKVYSVDDMHPVDGKIKTKWVGLDSEYQELQPQDTVVYFITDTRRIVYQGFDYVFALQSDLESLAEIVEGKADEFTVSEPLEFRGREIIANADFPQNYADLDYGRLADAKATGEWVSEKADEFTVAEPLEMNYARELQVTTTDPKDDETDYGQVADAKFTADYVATKADEFTVYTETLTMTEGRILGVVTVDPASVEHLTGYVADALMTKQFVDNEIANAALGTQHWLPAVGTFATLPTTATIDPLTGEPIVNTIAYLCRVMADEDESKNGVYQLIGGWESDPLPWTYFSDNLDFVDEAELDAELAFKEDKTNKVTSVSSSSTDTQYPSAKATYTAVNAKENTSNKSSSYTASSTTTYANTKALVDGLATKVTTVTGKGLSTNDFTNVYKESLDNEIGAWVYKPDDTHVVLITDRILTNDDTVTFYDGTTGANLACTVSGSNPYTYTFTQALPDTWGWRIENFMEDMPMVTE